MKKSLNVQGIAIPFFTEAQWLASRTVMQDSHTFHDSYAEFVERVIHAETKFRAQGKATIRVNIDPQVFADWCRKLGRKIDAESRGAYAAFKAAEQDRGR